MEAGYTRDDVERMLAKYREEELDVEKQIDNFEEVVERSDPKSLIERVAVGTYLSGFFSQLPLPDDGIGLSPGLAEYVLGKVIAADKTGYKDTKYSEIAKAAYRLHDAYLYSPMKELDIDEMSESQIEKVTLENTLKTRELTSSRFTFSSQPIEAAERAYTPHNEYLKKEVGFTIQEAIKFTNFIEEEIDDRFTHICDINDIDPSEYMDDMDTLERQHQHYKRTGELPKSIERDDFSRDNQKLEDFYEAIEDDMDEMWVSSDDLIESYNIESKEEEFVSFLSRMSTGIGSVERQFRRIEDINPIYGSPLIVDSGEYFLPHSISLRKALMNTFYYDLISMPGYGDPSGNTGGEFGDKWGDYVEEWAYDSLEQVFSNSNTYLNPKYSDNDEEAADILIDYKGWLINIQCKSKKLDLKARGGSYSHAESNLQDGIKEGANQSTILHEKLNQSSNLIELYMDEENITLDPANYRDYLSMVIIGEK